MLFYLTVACIILLVHVGRTDPLAEKFVLQIEIIFLMLNTIYPTFVLHQLHTEASACIIVHRAFQRFASIDPSKQVLYIDLQVNMCSEIELGQTKGADLCPARTDRCRGAEGQCAAMFYLEVL